MAAQGPATLSFPFDLGQRDTALADVVQPVGGDPALLESLNTRLGNGGGIPDKSPLATVVANMSSSDAAAGIVPSGTGSMLLCTKTGNARLTSVGATKPIASRLTNGALATSYYPYDRQLYGCVAGGDCYAAPATCVDDNGNTWFASVRNTSGGSTVFVSVVDTNGSLVIASYPIASTATAASSQPWVGLTATIGGTVVIWWLDGGTIKAQSATVNTFTLQLSLGSGPNSIYSPSLHTPGKIAVHADADHSYAYLVCCNSALATSISVVQVNIASWATTVSTQALGDTLLYVCIRQIIRGGTSYVAVGASLASNPMKYYLFTPTPGVMTLTWAVTGTTATGHVGCSFWDNGTTFRAVFAATHQTGDVNSPGLQGSGTTVTHHNIGTGAVVGSALVLPWKGIVSNGAWDRDANGVTYPLFAMQNLYNSAYSSSPANANYLPDPSIELYRVGDVTACSMVGRFAVDTALSLPAVTNGAIVANTNCLESSSSSVVLTWLESSLIRNETLTQGYPARYVSLSLTPYQPRYALDTQGLAMIGPGSASWDGQDISEWCPTQAPKVFAEANTGSTILGVAGTFQFAAVVQWKDATGQLHRSGPSNIFSLTITNVNQPQVHVTLPCSMRNGANQEGVQIIIYASQVGQSVLYAQSYTQTSASAYVAHFANISAPQQGAQNPAIYTDGTPGMRVPAQCPPSFSDVAVITSRAWGIKAENPNEVWFSQERQSGIAWEWSSDFTVALPAASGGGVAIVEANGIPTVLCKNGVWAITGSGPDATESNGSYNPPEQISDIGCSDKRSVLRTPAGVIYVSSSRFAVVGQGYSDDIDATLIGNTIPVIMRTGRDAVWLSSSSQHRCFNYAQNKWTAWDSTTIPNVTGAALDPVTGLIFCYSSSDYKVRTLDPSQHSTTAQMQFVTGQVLLGGPQDDNVVQDILFHCAYSEAHDFNVTIWTDYGTSTTYTVPAATITPAVVNGYYEIMVSPPSLSMRAIKLMVYETNAVGVAMQPVNCTILYSKNPGVRRAAIQATERI